VEVQALCAPSYFTSPRRTVTGADLNRVLVALAVIEKRLGLRLGDMDVYVNVVGGMRVTEPALDLGIALAVISSLKDLPCPPDACVFGEIGLAGEVRAVAHGERRAQEAGRLGFARCIVPRAGAQRMKNLDSKIEGIATLSDAVEALIPSALLDSGRRGAKNGRVSGKNSGRQAQEREGEGDPNALSNNLPGADWISRNRRYTGDAEQWSEEGDSEKLFDTSDEG
jgi:DNA repair protein RadA/Sms